MSLIWIVLIMAGLTYHTAEATMHKIKVRPFSTVQLPCEFSIVEGTDHLKFSWHRRDIDTVINIFGNQRLILENYKKYRAPNTVFSYPYNKKVPEGESPEYKGRIKLDHEAFGKGVLTLLLKNVTFEDEGVYTCKARSQYGMGQRVIELLVEDEEAPQVQFEMEDKEWAATCISTGWYKNPIVTWSDGTTDLTNKAEVKIMEARPDGTHRVRSVLRSPVTVDRIYRCLIQEAKKGPTTTSNEDELDQLGTPMFDSTDLKHPDSYEWIRS